MSDPWDMEDTIQMKPWMKTKKFVLGTVDNIETIMDHCIDSPRYALDVETTGLDNRVLDYGGVLRTVDRLVGICLSPDGVTGYYIPLNHIEEKIDGSLVRRESNVPWDAFSKAFRRLITATEEKQTVAIFHNGKFDHEFLQYHGEGEPFGKWDKTYMWDDTLILAYLSDSRRRQKGLKALSKELLDIEMLELKEIFPEKTNAKGKKLKVRLDFSRLDPEEPSTLWYGGGDGICTRLLYDIFAPDVLEPAHGFDQKVVYQIEKKAIAATRWMERNRIHLDKKKLGELIMVGHKEWFASIIDVYTAASEILGRDIMPGVYKSLKEKFIADDPSLTIKEQLKTAAVDAEFNHPNPVGKVTDAAGKKWPPIYDLKAAQQLGVMFEDMGVQGLKRTEKSGQIKTSKDELDRIVETAGKQFPFMGKIKRFREIDKALSTYLYPMFSHLDPLDDTMRVSFNGNKVDTGRYCTPAPKEPMVGTPKVNLQALPRAGGSKRPECMRRLRECITARRPNSVIVAIDYAGVELRLITNLSREPLWLTEFFHCSGCDRTFDRGDGQTTPEPPPARCPNCGSDKIGDLHTLTGISVFGKEVQADPDWKEYRGKAKSLNFALCYGGGGMAAQRATGVDRNEGNRMKRQFEGTYRTLKNWWDAQHAFGKQHGFVVTAFKRRYPLPDINHADGFFRSKAERNAVNGPIQGTSADVTKIAMGLVFNECKKRDWLDKVQMIITMHDELVFEIDLEILEEAVNVINPIMCSNPMIMSQNWPIPLTTDVEIGHDWTVPWDLNVLKYKEVRFIGDKKYYKLEDAPDGSDWETMETWPDTLRPFFKAVNEAMPAPTNSPQPVPTPDSAVQQRVTVAPDPIQENPVVESDVKPVAGPVTEPVIAQPAKTTVPSGSVFEYQLHSPLTLETLFRLSNIIIACKNKGTRILQVLAMDGTVLDLEKSYGKVIINPITFEALAQLEKI